MTDPGATHDGGTDTLPGDAHPGAGGLKSRIRQFLFGGGAPQRVGRFTIQRALGSGGMGTVYLAQDEELGRLVALKLVRYDRVSPRTQARLRREAQALAKLAHPNVVSVYEVGEHEGLLFVAMEYVEGVSLRGWLDAEDRGWEPIVEVFEQAAEGLAAAHRAGLIHRDFKPENVIVGADGRVRVVDFGLVATEHDADEVAALAADEQASLTEVALTQTGELIGTPAYMAPEQFLGETPTPASDQFSFFVALYEALARQRPFPGASVHDTMRSVLEGQPRALRGASLPASLRSTITRGIARAPGERFPDMDAVLAKLRQARGQDARARVRRRLAAATLPLLAAVGLTLWMLPDEPQPSVVTELEVTQVAADPNQDEQARAALAPLLELGEDDHEGRLRLAEAYLAAHAEDGGVARRLIAEAAIGEGLWRRTCADDLDGLCISVSALEPGIERCAELDAIDRRERSEDAERARERLELAAGLAAAAGEPADPRERAALADAIALARTRLADAELESYLDIHAPRGLDFAKPDEHTELSKDAFASFVSRKQELGQRLARDYKQVKDAGSERWNAIAAARTGLVFHHLAAELLLLPVPRSMTEAEQRQAYCDALVENSKPMLDQAEAAFGYCRSKAEPTGLDPSRCALPSRPSDD